MNYTGIYQTKMHYNGITELYWTKLELPDYTELFLTKLELPEYTGLYWTMLYYARLYPPIPEYQTIVDYIGLY